MLFAGSTKEAAVRKVKEKFGEIFHEHNDGRISGMVCLCCDRMLYVNGVCWLHRDRLKLIKNLFKPVQEVRSEVEMCYKYVGDGYESYMAKLVLSPRGCFDKSRKSFAVCAECYNSCSLTVPSRPYFALSNNWMVGDPPEELNCLSDMELAIVARSRISGHIFSFYGGQHKCLSGLHSLYDVNAAHLMGSVERMEQLGFPAVIACVLNGPFTKQQKNKVKQKIVNIDRRKVARALR